MTAVCLVLGSSRLFVRASWVLYPASLTAGFTKWPWTIDRFTGSLQTPPSSPFHPFSTVLVVNSREETIFE